jgi:hypothetical protein
MSTPIGARRDKAKFIWMVNQDGLWDIFLGLGILGIALDIALNQDMWLIGMWLIGYFVVLSTGKEVITRPRMGHFNLGAHQAARVRKAILVGLTALISTLVLGTMAYVAIKPSQMLLEALLAENAGLFFAIIAAIGLSLFAHFGEGSKRYYIIAIFVLVSFILQRVFSASALPLLFSIAGLFLISGVITSIHFIIRYPKAN